MNCRAIRSVRRCSSIVAYARIQFEKAQLGFPWLLLVLVLVVCAEQQSTDDQKQKDADILDKLQDVWQYSVRALSTSIVCSFAASMSAVFSVSAC
jgi:VanZ family protein